MFPVSAFLCHDTADGSFRNPANYIATWEGTVVHPIIYDGFSTIPGGCLEFLNHQTVPSNPFANLYLHNARAQLLT